MLGSESSCMWYSIGSAHRVQGPRISLYQKTSPEAPKFVLEYSLRGAQISCQIFRVYLISFIDYTAETNMGIF